MASSSSSTSTSTYYATKSTLVMYCIWTIAWLYFTSIVSFVYCDSTTSAAVPIVAVNTGSPTAAVWNRSTALDTYALSISPITAQRNTRSSEKEDYYSSGGRFSPMLRSWNLIATPQDRQDICESNCKCSKNNTFITINCDFSASKKLNAIFGSNFLIPERATSLNVKLAPGTNLRIERGFFQNSRINRLLIEGNLDDTEQVEISSGAFDENRGPYPEIDILDCHSVILRAKAFSAGELKLRIRRSNDVIIYGNAFKDTLVRGTFGEINDLRIEEQAFNSSKAKLDIISSNLENIYQFEASLKEIRFYNCTIGTVNSKAFDVISIESIKFEKCKIGFIKSGAITGKLLSQHLAITGSEIGTIESEAISGSGINEVIISRNKFETIQSNAIDVNAINFVIHKNNIKYVGNNWLHVREWSNITIINNMFGIFGRMILEKTKNSEGVHCKFDGNSLTKPLPGSLNMPHPLCQIREVSINSPCNCNTSWLEKLSDRDLRSESYCTVDNKLQFCFNTTMFNVLKYINEVCDETKTYLDCIKNRTLKKINGQFFTQEELEKDTGDSKKLFIAGGVFFLILLAVIAVLTARKCAKRRKANYTSKHVHEFSPHDRRIIEHTVEIIKNKYPHIHTKFSEAIKDLLRRDIQEEKCVDIVNTICYLLSTCESSESDFAAFNEILIRHLYSKPPARAPPVSDPIYAEPTAPMGYDGDGVEQTNLPPEHIYAEPGSVQQPLLRGEYASPRDRHNDMGDLYSEPISDRDIQNQTSYATTNFSQSTMPTATSSTTVQKQQRPQLPSTSHNLPDVLGQPSRGTLAKPLTNVQKMAQNLENSPQFSGRLPIYTEINPSRKVAIKPSSSQFAGITVKDSTERRGHSTSALSSDSGSDHSGGSDVTIKIDDIEYADA